MTLFSPHRQKNIGKQCTNSMFKGEGTKKQFKKNPTLRSKDDPL